MYIHIYIYNIYIYTYIYIYIYIYKQLQHTPAPLLRCVGATYGNTMQNGQAPSINFQLPASLQEGCREDLGVYIHIYIYIHINGQGSRGLGADR